MTSSPRQNSLNPRYTRALALTLAAVMGLSSTGFAQTTDFAPSPSRVRDALARPTTHITFGERDLDLTQAAVAQNGVVQRPAPRPTRSRPQRLSPPVNHNRGSSARRIAGAAIGAIAGFWVGAELGVALEGDNCNCDDPGMMGLVVGAPVGAALGGLLGALLGGK